MTSLAVGIDFGTSTTLVAVARNGSDARVVPIGRTTPWLPSVAGLRHDGSLAIGEDALVLDPRRQIRSIKSTVTNGTGEVIVDGITVHARDIMTALMKEAIERAEAQVPDLRKAGRFFLGCPALWDGWKRELLASVAYRLGLGVDVADIIDEPVAAGLHAVHSSLVGGRVALEGPTVIFDAGGGTLDVAYLDVTRVPTSDFTVKSADGIPISGDAVDLSISSHLSQSVQRVHDSELAGLLLRARSRELKELLSQDTERTVALGGGYDVTLSLTRTELEKLFEQQLQYSVDSTRSTVRGAELRSEPPQSPTVIRSIPWDELAAPVQHVVLVGGLSQMPVISTALAAEFPNAHIVQLESPQESVVLGLALGDRLNRLNLPRPPISFIVEFCAQDDIGRQERTTWELENRYAYAAYTPLYSWASVQEGMSPIGYRHEIPFPAGARGTIKICIGAEFPDRDHTPLVLNFRQENDTAVLNIGSTRWIELTHSRQNPASFALYPTGEIMLNGSKGEVMRCKVDKWPTLRGVRHDATIEQKLQLKLKPNTPWRSQLQGDDWRFQ